VFRACVSLALFGCGRIAFDPLGGNAGGPSDSTLSSDGSDASTRTTAFDDFNRADNTNLGSDWTTIGGALARSPGISSNGATCCPDVPNDESTALWMAPFTPDQFSQITVVGVSDVIIGVVVRGSKAEATAYFCGKDRNSFSDDGLRIVRWSVNAFELTTSTDTTLTSGDVLRLEVVGTTLTCSINGSTVLTASNTALASGQPGFLLQSAVSGGAAVDDWSGGEL
jgi:hypothetical protein